MKLGHGIWVLMLYFALQSCTHDHINPDIRDSVCGDYEGYKVYTHFDTITYLLTRDTTYGVVSEIYKDEIDSLINFRYSWTEDGTFYISDVYQFIYDGEYFKSNIYDPDGPPNLDVNGNSLDFNFHGGLGPVATDVYGTKVE